MPAVTSLGRSAKGMGLEELELAARNFSEALELASTDAASVEAAITPEVDTVFHLVGILTEVKPATFKSIHVEGTRNVVNACLKKGVGRYLHISALGTRPAARSLYHKTKWEAEEIIRASTLESTIFRPSVIFGKEDKFTNLFASVMRISPVIFIPGSGKNRMQPVFVRDLVKAMAKAVEMEGAWKKTFEIAGPIAMTFDEIMDKIAEAIGRKRLKVHVPMPIMRINASLAESVLSRPPITADQLLMLEEDNVTPERALEEVFGIKPTGFLEGMRTYLH